MQDRNMTYSVLQSLVNAAKANAVQTANILKSNESHKCFRYQFIFCEVFTNMYCYYFGLVFLCSSSSIATLYSSKMKGYSVDNHRNEVDTWKLFNVLKSSWQCSCMCISLGLVQDLENLENMEN